MLVFSNKYLVSGSIKTGKLLFVFHYSLLVYFLFPTVYYLFQLVLLVTLFSGCIASNEMNYSFNINFKNLAPFVVL